MQEDRLQGKGILAPLVFSNAGHKTSDMFLHNPGSSVLLGMSTISHN